MRDDCGVRSQRRKLLGCLAAIAMLSANGLALAEKAVERRIYRTDSVGHIQYHAPSYTVRGDGRIVETDFLGHKQYHKPQYQIKGGRADQIDSLGYSRHPQSGAPHSLRPRRP